MNLSEFIDRIKTTPEIRDAFVYHRYIPPESPSYGSQPDFHDDLVQTMKSLGIDRLYSHQTEALDRIHQGAHALLATPTASGKTLVYNLAVLEKMLMEDRVRALYLFPLKALEQDQLKTLSFWLKGLRSKNITADIYDGDTSPYRRKKIRENPPHILFTNPDMLHRGILSYHQNWEKVLKELAFIVVDEVHTYRGIFGSHMSQIIRRLKRLCRPLGARPQFIMLSATVCNPGPFGEALIGEKVEVIQSMGAPKSGQHFLFLNPLTSPNFSAARLFVDCIRRGFRTIAFTQSRKVTELIHVWVSQLAPDYRKKISSYRAGFMPEERRQIEQKMASGELLGVISTSALELGIDIGSLDVCLLVGYPGTIINTWQRGGRVGRSGRDSMVVLMAKPDALDQYFMKHPEDLFDRSFEAAVLDPNNEHVMDMHLPCAAAERPITKEDARYWPERLPDRLAHLENKGVLHRSADGEPAWYAVRKTPHLGVDIRSTGEQYTIFEKETGQAIGGVDGIRAFKECHPGAVYLHRGRQYLVDLLDLKKKDIVVHLSRENYFTRALSEKETEIIEIFRSKPAGQFLVREGRLKVTETVTGYEKRALPGQELVGVHSLQLPPQTFETVGFWFEIESALKRFVEKKGLHFMGCIHALEHASIGIFPLFALCDRNDVGGICYPFHPQLEKSAVFIYDGHAGGVGLSRRGFDMVVELLEKTEEHVRSCECEDGCPSCIHSPKCGSGNKPLDKKASLLILEGLLGRIPLSDMVDGEEEIQPLPVRDKEKPEAPEKGPRVIYLDVETQKTAQDVGGWGNAHLMRISVAILYDSLQEQFGVFREEQMDALFEHLVKADLIVGFNIKGFDYKVLGAYTNRSLKSLPTFDILEDVHQRLGFRLSLDHLAQETLEEGKTADGLQAVAWFRQGEMEKLIEYCQHDVAVTRDLFQFGLQNKHLIYRKKSVDRRLRLPVDWDLDQLIHGDGE